MYNVKWQNPNDKLIPNGQNIKLSKVNLELVIDLSFDI